MDALCVLRGLAPDPRDPLADPHVCGLRPVGWAAIPAAPCETMRFNCCAMLNPPLDDRPSVRPAFAASEPLREPLRALLAWDVPAEGSGPGGSVLKEAGLGCMRRRFSKMWLCRLL